MDQKLVTCGVQSEQSLLNTGLWNGVNFLVAAIIRGFRREYAFLPLYPFMEVLKINQNDHRVGVSTPVLNRLFHSILISLFPQHWFFFFQLRPPLNMMLCFTFAGFPLGCYMLSGASQDMPVLVT
jgi:hypothetical protein